MDKVLPFRCTKCDREYNPEEGGICNVCHQPFCSFHLYKAAMGTETIYVCDDHKNVFLNTQRMARIGNLGLPKLAGMVLIAAIIFLLACFVLFVIK